MKIDCYKLLQLDKETANQTDVKKAYRKLALKYHPDKQPKDASEEDLEKANKSFIELGIAYSVLNDPKRKELFDKTGSIDENQYNGPDDWTAYFKELWTGVVSSETINNFKSKYQGSEEERKDVLEAYKRCKGKMDQILKYIEGCEYTDAYRFEQIILAAIKEEKVPFYRSLEQSTTEKAYAKREKRHEEEEAIFNKMSSSIKKRKGEETEEMSLSALIQNRQKHSRVNAVISALESKCNSEAEVSSEPSEEEFQRIQERLMNQSSKKRKQK
ncbi:DnaJ domain-containing protein [Pilobolus umbonatus]|nr:DnaJ domain-containing protein [Pilobolus umbonatus]